MNQLVLIRKFSENGYFYSYENTTDKWSIKIEKRTSGYSKSDTLVSWYVNVLDRKLEWKEIMVLDESTPLSEVKDTVAKLLDNMHS